MLPPQEFNSCGGIGSVQQVIIMKFKLGLPPETGSSLIGADRLVTDYGRLHVQATLIGLFAVAPCLYFSWALLWPHIRILGIFDESPAIFIGTLVGIVVAHEIIHLLTLPGSGRGDQSYMGFDPKTHLPYVAYLGELTRRRMLLVVLMPTLVLTLLPFLLAYMWPADHIQMLAACSMLNGAAASADFCMIFLLLRKVPRNGIIQGEFYGLRSASDIMLRS
jgi:hypothetical protein